MNDESYSEHEESSSPNRCSSHLFFSSAPEWEPNIMRMQYTAYNIYVLQITYSTCILSIVFSIRIVYIINTI